jgi:hypothetical protein
VSKRTGSRSNILDKKANTRRVRMCRRGLTEVVSDGEKVGPTPTLWGGVGGPVLRGLMRGERRECGRKTVRSENKNTLRMSPLRRLEGWLFAGNAPSPARAEDERTDWKPYWAENSSRSPAQMGTDHGALRSIGETSIRILGPRIACDCPRRLDALVTCQDAGTEKSFPPPAFHTIHCFVPSRSSWQL